ncbi:MAG: DNA-deoxyinosine glycosylase [Clostridiales bacterium]|nr:DNA-deoxyinosine glycosylase [Clostridiales bacterium]
MEKLRGFEPIFDENSRVLVLGSFPSVKSRQAEFYYGNRQNRFWKVLSEAFCEIEPLTVEDKIRLCLQHNVAIWDIVASCRITGSMDADIKDYELVDLQQVLKKAKIQKILCNGAMSYKLTLTVYDGDLPIYKLPSTSPANVRFDKSVWFAHLR